jgi:predicted metalloprotease with PDZ domain
MNKNLHKQSSHSLSPQSRSQRTLRTLNKKFLIVLLLSTFSLVYCQSQKAQNSNLSNELKYELVVDSVNNEIKVVMYFTATDSTHTIIKLPSEFGSEKDLYKAVKDIRVVSPEGASVDSVAPGVVAVGPLKSNSPVELSYILKQDWEGPMVYPRNYRAVINQNFIHFTGYALFAVPEYLAKSDIDVSVNWKSLPKSWKIANSFSAGETSFSQKLDTRVFLNTLHIAGDFEILKTEVKGKPVNLAVRGSNWKLKNEELLGQLQQTLQLARDFWKDHTEPYYLVSLIPFEGQGSFNGSALHQSFLLGATEEFDNDNMLNYFLMHEYLHRWIGQEVVIQAEGQEHAWFTEGFTDFYTYKLLLEGGTMSFDDYLNNINTLIGEYYKSKIKNMPIDSLGDNYWKTADYQKIPYHKGLTIALWLDNKLRARSGKSLDKLMFKLIEINKKGEEVTFERFVSETNKMLGRDISRELRAWILDGETVPVDENSISGATGKLVDIEVFDAGFDLDKSLKEKMVHGAVEGSAAWNSGLRNGQILKTWSLYYGKTKYPITLQLFDNGEARSIQYFPVALEKVPVMQFEKVK